MGLPLAVADSKYFGQMKVLLLKAVINKSSQLLLANSGKRTLLKTCAPCTVHSGNGDSGYALAPLK